MHNGSPRTSLGTRASEVFSWGGLATRPRDPTTNAREHTPHHESWMEGLGAGQPLGPPARPTGQVDRDRVQPGMWPGLGDTRLTGRKGKNTIF